MLKAMNWHSAVRSLAIVITIGLIVIPLWYILNASVIVDGRLDLPAFWRILTDDVVLKATLNSVTLSAGVAVLSVLFGTILAFGVMRTDMRWRPLVKISVIISVISPDFLLAMAYVLLMGPNNGYMNIWLQDWFGLGTASALGSVSGPLNIFSLWGFIVVALPTGVAFVYMQVAPALGNMNPELEEAARTHGAMQFRTIWRITLPLVRPAIASGALLAFIITMAMYGTPYILGINVMTTQIRNALLITGDLHRTSGIALISVVITLSILWFYRRSTRSQKRFETVVGKNFKPGIMKLGRVRHLLTLLGVLYAVFAFVLPYATLILVSFSKRLGSWPVGANFTFDNYRSVLTSARVLAGVQNSAVLALGSATIVLVLSVIIGREIVRSRTRIAAATDYIAMMPLGIAGTGLAAGLIVAYLRPPLGLLAIYGTLWLLLIAYITRFLGLGIRSAETGMRQISAELEEAARVAGAGPLRTLTAVTVPLIRNSLTFAWILVFIRAFPEISASVMLQGVGMQTSATVLLDLWDGSGGFAVASALATLMFIVIAVGMILAQKIGTSKLSDL